MKSEISKSLKDESKDRKKMMEEVTSNLDTYSYRVIELENKIKEYELEEIKYRSLQRENKEVTKIYELKLEDLKNKIVELEKENKEIKKELINERTASNNLKSILQVIIKKYGTAISVNREKPCSITPHTFSTSSVPQKAYKLSECLNTTISAHKNPAIFILYGR